MGVQDRSMLDQLRKQVEQIGPDVEGYAERRPPEVPGKERVPVHSRAVPPSERMPFGRWLLKQQDRGGLIGQLAQCAAKDPGFPKSGGPNDVYDRLRVVQAPGDMYDAFEDAELDWSSY